MTIDELIALLDEVYTETGKVLDADGIVYWSREVLERLQGTCQPAGLLTFWIDDGGGTYAFWCSSGVFTLDHQRGLLARYDDVPAFFRTMLDVEPSDPAAVERALRAAEMEVVTPLDVRLAGRTDAEFRPYDPYLRWAVGDLMHHPQLGRGIVTAVKTTMYIQVEFASGRTTLDHKGWT